MLRKIVQINPDKCNGCGLCISGCHEGALKLIDGKAKLISDSYCDGLGACLPDCPTGAITIIEREAPFFDEAAVQQHLAENALKETKPSASGCPGAHAKTLIKHQASIPTTKQHSESELRQWPCQLQLVPVTAPYFDQADLLIAADCSAYAYSNFHADFMQNKITLIGCPKLDQVNYATKLTEILKLHPTIKSITVIRMEVPCCAGIVNAVKEALLNSAVMIPWKFVVIGTDGTIREE